MSEHTDIKSLLGAYVLHAVTPLEHKMVERHLTSCEDCTREVRLLSDASAELSVLSGPADVPTDLVDRIVDAIPRGDRRSSTWLRASVGIAAVAVVVAGVLGGLLMTRGSNFGDVVAAAKRSGDEVHLAAAAGFEGEGTLYLADDRAALELRGVDVPDGRVLELWALNDGEATPMIAADGDGRIERVFDWDADADTYAVTIERAKVDEPTTSPVLLGSPA